MANIFKYLVVIFISICTLSSCSDEKSSDEPEAPVVNGIDQKLLPGIYSFNGNIAPSFTLYPDGKCTVTSNGASSTTYDGTWHYNPETCILAVASHAYTVKLLSEDVLVGEWTSVKYGTRNSTWRRKNL